MIEFEAVPADVTRAEADLLIVPCYSGLVPGPGAAAVASALGIDLTAALARQGFTGELGDAFSTLTLGRLPAAAVLVVGLGPLDQAGPGAIRQAALQAAGQMTWAARIATTLPAAWGSGPDGEAGTANAAGQPAGKEPAARDEYAGAAAFSEGLLIGAYQYDRYRREPVSPGWRRPAIEKVQVLTAGAVSPGVTSGLRRGAALAGLTNWVRDLVNASPSDATPDDLAEEARSMAAACGLASRVLGVPELTDGGFGGILGVGQGSRNEPRLVELSYRGGGDGPVIAMTGKGITFDSGGLTLKRTSEIEWMKSDMAGAATVMAVLRGAAEFGLPVNIDAVLPFAENMPGGSAQRPGDVLTHRGGRTSEVSDTDNEGRVLVADTLAYLSERNPAMLIDVAGLTDAAGLGASLWAVLGSDERQIAELIAAGQQAGDPGWHLPLPAGYRRHLASVVADVRNAAADVPDTCVLAAMYLREFTAGLPWMHIDNGSTSYLERPGDGWPEGATGSPTRALLSWVERWVASRSAAEVTEIG